MSMYTNINTEVLMDFIVEDLAELIVFKDHNRKILEGIWEILVFVIHNNFFQFRHKFYKQTGGLAIGSLLSLFLVLCYLHVHKLETTLLAAPSIFCMYGRYMDDIIFITENTDVGITDRILEMFNQLEASLNFILEVPENNCLNFLDITIKIKKGKIETESYKKPTNTNKMLDYHSSHPAYIKQNTAAQFFEKLHRYNTTRDTENSTQKNYEVTNRKQLPFELH